MFAQGQAGVVSGYFALVRPRVVVPRRVLGSPEADPALLSRISRGVRRPLNTIIGFAELLNTKAFGELGDERYVTYAQDIAAAGQDIAALVDELEDYARLREGKYLPDRASLDLTELLETCVLRIRNQANAERIIVRNAISETLPRVTADRASLNQAVLNLLASAIDQSPTGGTVVISPERRFDPEHLWRLIEAERVTFLVIVGDAFARPLVETYDVLDPPADATALTAVTTYRLDKEDFRKLWTARPVLSERLISFLCTRLRDTSGQLESIALHPMHVRLARFFLVAIGVRTAWPSIPATTSWETVAVSLLISAVTGVLFGMLPAVRAARLDPVAALRYE
jgi:hypothetical protein